MPHQLPLLDTFRAAEELANVVDRHMGLFMKGDHDALANQIRETTSFFMSYLVQAFPSVGRRSSPRQSLEMARMQLERLQASIQLLPRYDLGDSQWQSLDKSCRRVYANLDLTLSALAPDQPMTAAERHEDMSVPPASLSLR